MKSSYKEVIRIIKNTDKALSGVTIDSIKDRLLVGYYIPSNANWSYNIYVINYNGYLQEVAVVFGYIEVGGNDYEKYE